MKMGGIIVFAAMLLMLQVVYARTPQREGFSTIGWNGEYWLILYLLAGTGGAP
jgi:hypothetical protein